MLFLVIKNGRQTEDIAMLHTPLHLKPAFRIKNKPAQLDNSKLNSKLANTNELKEQLLKEMLELDKQRQNLDINEGVDFAMAQTYKEMIQSRRILLDQLNRTIS